MPLIRVSDIEKVYPGSKKALNGVTASFEKGAATALVGPNGCGKSTLLRIIAGLDSPSAGKVLEAGTGAISIGYVPERFPAALRFTVSEYLRHMGRIHGTASADLESSIEKLLERFGLVESRNASIRDLSKGMRQKVAIMQAMLWEPDLILLDEPLSGLDASSQDELIQILSTLKTAGATLVFSSHEEFLVKRLADKILYLTDGRIVSEVVNNPNPEGLRARSVIVVVVKDLEAAYESELREMCGVLSVTEAKGESTIVADDRSTTEILRSLLDRGAYVISLNRTEGIL